MREAVGVILAGGQGRRLGGAKATVDLGGRPLLHHPLRALRDALGAAASIAVVAKPATALPDCGGALLWLEPAVPSHPLVGLVRALQGAQGRAVVVCPVDLPFVAAATLRRLATGGGDGATAVLAAAGGVLQPLLGRWEPSALPVLTAALGDGEPLPAMRRLAERAGVSRLAVDPDELENVNTEQDLCRARARLISRR